MALRVGNSAQTTFRFSPIIYKAPLEKLYQDWYHRYCFIEQQMYF